MSNHSNTVKHYLSLGLSVVPTQADKTPALTGWKDLQKTPLTPEEVGQIFSFQKVRPHVENSKGEKVGIKLFVDPVGIAILGGAVSGGLEILDVDTKHDTTGSLWEELNTLLQDTLPELYPSLVIAQTKSGGYHIYYRCSEIEGNKKLATKENKEVLLETRGEGGYVVAPPSPGYTYLQGDPSTIPTITPEQRKILFSISQSFNELPEVTTTPKVATPEARYTPSGLSPFEDYNDRGDVVALLESNGWKVVNQSGARINLLRPGQTDSKTSGNFHTGLRVLRVFSSSTEFNPDIGYNPSQVFSLLECSGDNKLAYRRLLELGYGEPYSGSEIKPTQVKTTQIKVDSINTVTQVSSVISKPGQTLKIENIPTAQGEDIIITSPGDEARAEVLQAIQLAQGSEKRIYIKEGATEPIREYKYQLRALFEKYATIQEESGGLTDRETDNLLDEVIKISLGLEPIDRDIFKKDFLSLETIKELGITEESLSITLDRLTSTREKEAQEKAFKKLLSEATELQEVGDTKKALELLETKLKEVKLKGAESLLPPPMSFNTLLEDIATIPQGYRTGYPSLDKFIDFTPGAISLIAGRPSHGKTTFMFNLLLEMAKLYPEEKFYFFTYEEPVRNISVKLLNRLTGMDLKPSFSDYNLSTPTNYEFLKNYIKTRRTDIPWIEEGKRQLKELIDSQRITLIGENYSVEDLSKLIGHLQRKEKIGAVFIDYIQRMRTERRTQDKRTEIAHISDQTLQIAKDTGLPIILGAQLNRATTSTTNKKPVLENLKEAGNLEEDANLVLSVYNESREKEDSPEGESYKGVREVELEIKTLKNREGEVNQTASLTFDKWTGLVKEPKTSYKSSPF
jgi:replicative DNA helicase